ncbi:MAG: hypothetical protein JSW43_13035 [Gemmatimonadota bacterium]|nr:MAG: hypothetical protein JSW43_13035 [Gemmatimonadota bacterium]
MKPVRFTLLLAAALLGLAGLGCGGAGNVYVGVGVVGPYWGYPYPPRPYPGVYGRPPYYREDASLDTGARTPRIEQRADGPTAHADPGSVADSTQQE